MKKLVLLLLLAVLASSCGWLRQRRDLIISNGCKGSWLIIMSGDDVVIERFDYGYPPISVDVSGWGGREIEVVAYGYRLPYPNKSQPMGLARQRFYLPRYDGGPITAPSDLETWNITHLYDSAGNNECEWQ